MPIANWTRTPDWDSFYLGGRRVPGVAHVEVSMGSGIATRKPKGAKKAKKRDVGAPAAEVKVTVELLPTELPEFEANIVPLLRPRNLSAPREPLDCSHPNTRLWGINVVLAGKIDSPHPESGGTLRISFTLEEWSPQPTEVKASSTKPKPENDEDADWNVQPLIDALRPGNSGGAAANF